MFKLNYQHTRQHFKFEVEPKDQVVIRELMV